MLGLEEQQWTHSRSFDLRHYLSIIPGVGLLRVWSQVINTISHDTDNADAKVVPVGPFWAESHNGGAL